MIYEHDAHDSHDQHDEHTKYHTHHKEHNEYYEHKECYDLLMMIHSSGGKTITFTIPHSP